MQDFLRPLTSTYWRLISVILRRRENIGSGFPTLAHPIPFLLAKVLQPALPGLMRWVYIISVAGLPTLCRSRGSLTMHVILVLLQCRICPAPMNMLIMNWNRRQPTIRTFHAIPHLV